MVNDDLHLYPSIILGLFGGLKLAVLLSLLSEWYRTHELPFRVLLLFEVSPKVELIVRSVDSGTFYFRPAAFVSHVLIMWLLFVSATPDLIGRPREVFWLTLYQKVIVYRDMGVRKFLNDAGGTFRAAPKVKFAEDRRFVC